MPMKPQKKPITRDKMTGIIVLAVAILILLSLLIGGVGKSKKGNDDKTENPTSQDTQQEQGENAPELWETTDGPVIEDYEDTSSYLEQDAVYKNDKVLKFTYNDAGDSISIGAAINKNSDILYLNPVASIATKEEPVGFIMTPSRCDILYANPNFKPSYEGENAGKSNFIIWETYDSVASAEYQDDENYGIGWANDILYDGKMEEGTTIDIRAIVLRTGRLLTIAKAEIVFNQKSGSYEIKSLRSADVKDNGEMSEEDRTILLNNAVSIAANKDYGPNDPLISEDWRENAVSKGIVEKVSSMYFYKCLDYQENLKYSDAVSNKLDNIYAVSIPYPEGGFMTMYFSPEAPVIRPNVPLDNMVEVPLILDEPSIPLNYFARDIFMPISKTSQYTPYGFYS